MLETEARKHRLTGVEHRGETTVVRDFSVRAHPPQDELDALPSAAAN